MFAIVMCFVLFMCILSSSSSVLCLFIVVCDGECDVVSDECDEPNYSFMRS